MAGINKAVLVGRVGKDPEIMRFRDGNEVATFSLATSETWRDRQSGDRRERTQWHHIKVTGEATIKIVRQYINKGDMVGVDGQIEYREWEKDGRKGKATEIVVGPFNGKVYLLGGAGGGEGQGRGGGSSKDDQRHTDSSGTGGGSGPDMDDEIPFGPEWRI